MDGSLCAGRPVTGPEPALDAFLVRAGLAAKDEATVWEALSGGVSSDIWHVRAGSGEYCVKRALAQLKVAADWKAPVERNATEWAYIQLVSKLAPGAVPEPVAHDPVAGLFAMQWLPPERFALWKAELLAGHVDVAFATRVGLLLGTIHAETADHRPVGKRFATDAAFHALRIEPYLLAVAEKNPRIARQIRSVAAWTAATRRALVHGDVSPKNILVGRDGPVLLDAEVAWFGDPAFDLAFCLNHLAIKRRVVAGVQSELDRSFDALARAYLALVHWEDRAELEGRAARLLPMLALARVDGKSPVEYLSIEQGAELRSAAIRAIVERPDTLSAARDILVS